MTEHPCDRCQSQTATSYSGTSRLCAKCHSELSFELAEWSIENQLSEHPVITRQLLKVGNIWQKIFRKPQVENGRLTGNVAEFRIDVVKQTFYRAINRSTGECVRINGNAVSCNITTFLEHASEYIIVEEFQAWVAVNDSDSLEFLTENATL